MTTANLFGFVGAKQSGKNTSATIWQALDYHYNYLVVDDLAPRTEGDSVNSFLQGYNDFKLYQEMKPTWKQKSFAHKLKVICSTLTGRNLEDWECNDFKVSPSGIITNMTWGDGTNIPSNRELLTFIGSELFRDQLSKSIWINALFADYKEGDCPHIARRIDHNNRCNTCRLPKWLITDVRFPNEAKTIRDNFGKLIKVINQDLDREKTGCLHETEMYHENITCDYVISAKRRDIKSLTKQIKNIMIKENIITR